MSPSADVNIRWLVENAVRLADYSSDSRINPHPIGYGISSRKSYAHPDGPLTLPTTAEALVHLRSALTSSILDLSEDLQTASWNALLDKPSLIVPLPVPNEEWLIEKGVTISGAERTLLRAVGLGVVTQREVDSFEAGRTIDTRMAGTGTLVSLGRTGSKSIDDVWFFPSWTTSTRGLGAQLEGIVGAGAKLARRLRRVALIVGPEWPAFSDQVSTSLVSNAAVFGVQLVVWRHTALSYGSLKSSMLRESPSALIHTGPVDSSLGSLLDFYKSAAGGGEVLALDTGRNDTLGEAVGDALALLTRVTPGLQPMAFPTTEAEASTRVPLPITGIEECLHDATERFYARETGANRWWTRDTARHASVTFKTYELQGNLLIHENDRDGLGKPVTSKYKGESGKKISVGELHGCSHPESHLG